MGILATLFFTLVSIVFVAPIFIVLINSMKSKTFINLETFKLPTRYRTPRNKLHRAGRTRCDP